MPLPSFRMGQTYGATTTPFTPTSLFASGEQGVWYDPSDFIPNWRRNLLTYTEDFSNAAWAKPGVTVSATKVLAPDGTLTGSKLIPSNASSEHYLTLTLTSSFTGYSGSVYAKAGEYNRLILGTGTGQYFVGFNLTTGIIESTLGSGITSASIVSVGNGWYRCSYIYSSSRIYIACFNSAYTIGAANPIFVGDGTSGIYIWGAQLEKGSLTTYQKITDGLSSDYLRSQPLPVLYQDSTGTIPVYGVEQPVGLMLDKSKGLVLGAELITNGGFDTDTDWVKQAGWGISGGAATFTPGTAGFLSQNISSIAGKLFQMTLTVTQGQIIILGSQYLQNMSLGVGTYKILVTPTYNSIPLYATTLTTIDNISVKEIAGNHAKAPADANRPTLSARVNLLTYTEDFSNAVWGKNGLTISATKVLAPDGTITAQGVFESNIGSAETHLIYYTPTISATTAYTFSFYIKTNGRTLGYIAGNSTGWGSGSIEFNLGTGIATGSAGWSATITNEGNGWYRIIGSRVSQSLAGNYLITVVLKNDLGNNSYTGDITKGVYLWHPDLRPTNAGSLLPPYQRVNAATDYNTVGFPLYLKCNGTSSAMSTSSINFTTTDKITVVSGLRKLSDATIQIALEFSVDMNINNGTFLLAPGYAGFSTIVGAYWTGQIKGGQTQATLTTVAAFPSPISGVNTLIGKTSTPYAEFRLNGNSIAINTTSQGSGTYGNYPLHLFSRANSSLWYNGQFYGAIVRGETTSTPILLDAENYIATKTGITF